MMDSSAYITVIEKLLEKTKLGRVPWKPTFSPDTFVSVREGFTFQISRFEGFFSLEIRDKEGQTVFWLTGNSGDASKELGLLQDVYRLAREEATRNPKKLNEVVGVLDRM